MNRQFKEMPDHMEWRVTEEDQLVPCPVCQHPMYRKAKLGRAGALPGFKRLGMSAVH